MTVSEISNLGHRIAQERLAQNLTQLALANRAGVAYSTLRKIESTGHGSMGHYAAILQALGQVDQLPFSSSTLSVAQPCPPRKRARASKTDEAKLAASATVANASQPPAKRPSEKLGLDFPYDWSNPAISDAALIGKVLDRARFMDVSKTFAHYGHPAVEKVAQDLGIDLDQGVLGSLMPGIKRGLEKTAAHV